MSMSLFFWQKAEPIQAAFLKLAPPQKSSYMKKYELAAQYIREKVIPEMKVGERIPPESELAKKSGVCLMTLRRSIEELCHQGILSRVPEHRAVLSSINDSLSNNKKVRRVLIFRLCEDVFYSELLLAVQQAMIESGRFNPILQDVMNIPSDKITSALRDIISKRAVENEADAVVILPVFCNLLSVERRLSQLSIPMIGLLGGVQGCRNQLILDQSSASYHALRYLYEGHCRNIWYIGLTVENQYERGAGVIRFFQEYYPHVKYTSRIINSLGCFEDGYRAFKELYERGERPDGILAHNDLCANGIITAARELGVHVPQHLSVIGIDNLSSSMQITPKLTSMAVPGREIAQKVIEMLEHVFHKGVDNATIRVIMQLQLYWRESVRFRG